MNMKYMKTNYICMKKIKILYTLYMLPGGLQIGGSYSFSQLLKKSKKTKKKNKKKMRKPRHKIKQAHKKTKRSYKKGMLMKHKEGLMKYKKNKWIKI